MTRLLTPLESAEQAVVIRWAHWHEMKWRELRWLFAVPNGELRTKVTAARLKGQGVKPGVPDLWLPVPRGPYVGLVIEMKRVKGGKPTEGQQIWIDGMSEQGWHALTCWGADEAIATIRQYMLQPAIQRPATRIDQEPRSSGGRVSELDRPARLPSQS